MHTELNINVLTTTFFIIAYWYVPLILFSLKIFLLDFHLNLVMAHISTLSFYMHGYASLADRVYICLSINDFFNYIVQCIWWGSCYSIFSFMCMFCRSLFVLLFFVFFVFGHFVVCPSICGFWLHFDIFKLFLICTISINTFKSFYSVLCVLSICKLSKIHVYENNIILWGWWFEMYIDKINVYDLTMVNT